MTIAFGVAVLVLGLFAWLGQVVALVDPQRAARLGLSESEERIDPAFHADGRAECLWDSLTLWVLPTAAALLLAGHPSWRVLAPIGGAMYLYFGGRGVLQRRAMRRRAVRIGSEANVKSAYVFLTLWGLAGASMIARALVGG